jgi:hypothetical protein
MEHEPQPLPSKHNEGIEIGVIDRNNSMRVITHMPHPLVVNADGKPMNV